MGFLKKFFRNVLHEGESSAVEPCSSFAHVNSDALEAHLSVKRYGDFVLTDAVRPSFDLQVVPTEGYRHDVYRDPDSGTTVPVLMAAASRERLFELFLDLLEPLGVNVDVVLETSHQRGGRGHLDLYREHIDMPVLKSTLWDYEQMLLDDGCTGIAVLNPEIPLEVQFDEHKMLIMYGADLKPFEHTLDDHGIVRDESIKFITEAEHVHSSSDGYNELFEEFKTRLGMDSVYA